jgi:hypothetical protein
VARIACVSVDLTGLPHACRLHGVDERSLPPAGVSAVGRRAPDRLGELLDRQGTLATFFVPGEDLLDGPTSMAVAELSRLGHEIGSLGQTADPSLSRRPAAAVADEVRRAGAAIETLTGKRPVGFRAPGLVTAPAIVEALEDQGYAYDSSVLPSPAYWSGRAAYHAGAGLLGRRHAFPQDTGAIALAPSGPYRPDPRRPHRRGRGKIVEIPVGTAPITRFPFLGTFLVRMPRPAVAALYRAMRIGSFLHLAVSGLDVVDETDGVSPELASRQRDLRIPWSARRQRLAEVLGWIRQDFEVVPLEEVARRLAPELGSR